jgi:hypothetical protein
MRFKKTLRKRMRFKKTLRKKQKRLQRTQKINQKRFRRSRKINQKRFRRSRKINQKGGEGERSIVGIYTLDNENIGDAYPHQQYAYDHFMKKKETMSDLKSMHFVINMKISNRPQPPFDFFIEKDEENPDSNILILTTNPTKPTPPTQYKLLPSMLNTQPKIFAEKIVENPTGSISSKFDDALVYQQYAYDYFTVRRRLQLRLTKIEFDIKITTTPDSEVERHLFTITNNDYETEKTFANELWDQNFLKLTEGTVVHFLSKDENVLRSFIATKNRISSDLW